MTLSIGVQAFPTEEQNLHLQPLINTDQCRKLTDMRPGNQPKTFPPNPNRCIRQKRYNCVSFLKPNMSIKIEPGQNYLLDGKTVVKVLKAINRSLTIFNIETPGRTVESVEVSRLQPVPDTTLVEKEV